MLAAFPPTREDNSSYRALLKSALESGINPLADDERGRNALFILCEQMSTVPSDQCPDCTRLVHMLCDGSGNVGIGNSDRTGRTVFDITEKVAHSCLSLCKQLILDVANRNNIARFTGEKTTNFGNKWDFERSRTSSSVAANSYRNQSDNSSYGSSSRGNINGRSGSYEEKKKATNSYFADEDYDNNDKLVQNGTTHFNPAVIRKPSSRLPLDD